MNECIGKFGGIGILMPDRALTAAFLVFSVVSLGACSESNKSEKADQALPTATPSAPSASPSSTEKPRFTAQLPANFNGEADCRLAVDGKTVIDGKCFVEADNQFGYSLTVFERASKKGYFATVLGDGADVEGYWNGSSTSTHAQDSIGKVKKQGGCWTSNRGQICASPLEGGKGDAIPPVTAKLDMSTIRNWKCDGASGPFRMTFSNVQNAQWGKWGDVMYSPSSPFGFDGDNGFDYERKSSSITIGANAESGEQGIRFKINNQRGEMVFVSGETGDSIVCKPA